MRKGPIVAIALSLGLLTVGGYGVADAYDVVPGFVTLTPKPADPAGFPAAHGTFAAAKKAAAPINQKNAALPNQGALDAAAGKLGADVAQIGTEPPKGAGPKPSTGNPAVEKPAPARATVGKFSYAMQVVDVETGKQLLGKDADRAMMPASTTKVVAAITALQVLGPDHVLTTDTLLKGQTLYLRGGNDILLSADRGDPNSVLGRAGIGDLARLTAAELKKKKITAVTLNVDSTVAPQRTLHPDWVNERTTEFEGAPAALAIDTGRVTPKQWGYLPDPQARAVAAFIQHLKAAGITVTAGPAEAAAPQDAVPLAAVHSAPMGEILRVAIKESDNTLADMVARAAAVASGKPGTYAGATQTAAQTLATLKIPTPGLKLNDCSGLSVHNRIAPATLVGVVRAAAAADTETRTQLFGLNDDYPVAGFDGTLNDRYFNSPIAGLVRAKTGSLGQATSLTGTVQTSSGRVLAFAVIINCPEGMGAGAGRAAVDTFVAALAAS